MTTKEKAPVCRFCKEIIYECGCSGEKDWYCCKTMKPKDQQKVVARTMYYLEMLYHEQKDEWKVCREEPINIMIDVWKPLSEINKDNIEKEEKDD